MWNASFDTDGLLSDLNNAKAKLFIPAILYVGVLMLLGTAGNCMVLYFYGYKIKTTPSTSFIFALAIFDLVSCVVGMPMEIADLRYYFNFKSETACKILRCVTHFASISSGLILVIIAIDRYRRICKPFNRQINNKHVKVLCCITGAVSVMLAVPAIFFNEVVSVEIPEQQNSAAVKGKDCTTTKAEHLKPYLLIFNAVYMVAFILITLILSVLYSLIGRQLCRHQKFRSYVAKGGRKVKRITVRSGNDTNENLLSYRREASTMSNKVFADPPDASDSIVDMKEYVTRGLTQVETNRPSSGYTTVTGTTGLTGLTGMTDISGRTRQTMQSMKSVTICDPSKNQIFQIEARATKIKKTISHSESTWSSIEGRRPGSADSFTSVSTTRPLNTKGARRHQYATNFAESDNMLFTDPNDKDDDVVHVETTDEGEMREGDTSDEENDADETEGLTDYVDEEETELPIIEHEMNEHANLQNDDEHEMCIQDETRDISTFNNNEREPRLFNTHPIPKTTNYANDTNFDGYDNSDERKGDKANGLENSRSASQNDVLNDTSRPGTSTSKNDNSRPNTSKSEISRPGTSKSDNSRPGTSKSENDNSRPKSKTDKSRPSSKSSILSDKSRSSKGSKRSAVVSPMSCVTTTTVASRASTVKRMKRLLHKASGKSGSNKKTNPNNLKELRLKMLDLNTVKYTMIMIVITIVFVVSFLPYLALVIWRYLQDEHEMNILTDSELVLFQIGIRSIFLNSALNPLIYGGFNSKFRAFFYKLFCKCCTTNKRTRRHFTQPRDPSDSTSGS